MNEPVQTLRHRALVALARFVVRRALWIVIAALALAAGSVVYTAASIEFITDRNALVDPDAEYNRRFLAFVEAFGDQELMLLVIGEAPGPVNNPDYNPPVPNDAARANMKIAASRVVARLRERPDLFPQIVERVPPEAFGGTRMLYLPRADLAAIAGQVEQAKPVIDSVAAAPTFPALLQGMRDSIETGAGDAENVAQSGAQLQLLLHQIRDSLGAPAGSPPPGPLFEFRSSDPSIDADGYLFLWDGRLLYAALLPTRDEGALNQVEKPLAFAREVVADVAPDFPELAIGLTGRPVIYSDEMAASSRDMTIATIFAVIAVGLMFVIAFRSFTRPALAVLCLLLALCWTFGATTLFIGHLNIFAMVFAVVLVGLGIDFGIHLLSHYRHGISHGYSVRDALTQTYTEIGMGTVIGALTTAAALSTAALTDFLGLAELGLICGMGILFCLLAMLIVFPAMLVLLDQRRIGDGDPSLRAATRGIDQTPVPRPATGPLARVAAAVVAALVFGAATVAIVQIARGYELFDYDLLKLNDPSSEGIHWERLLIEHDARASYVASIRGSLDELAHLRAQYDELARKGLVRTTESILPENEDARRAELARIGASLPASFTEPGARSDAEALRTAARSLQSALRQLSARGPTFEQAFEAALNEISSLIELTRQRPGDVNERLRAVEPAFFGVLVGQLRELKRDADPPPVSAETLPEVLRPRYVGRGPQGETLYALYVYPAKNTWDRASSEEFRAAVLQVDPSGTGVVIQIHESGTLIASGFAMSVIYALIAIVGLLALDLRRPLALLIALFPLFASLAVLLAIMSVSALAFNFANFFGVPILIGTTVDAGVYLVHAQRHGDPRRTLRQTRVACLLCGLTTLLGFGALISASHQGIVSLGLVLIVGSGASIFASVVVVPAVLAWFNERGRRV